MRNALILLAIWAVALLTCFFVLSCDRSRSRPIPKQTGPPDSSPLFEPHGATLAQQKMCDEQAAKRFEEYTDKKDRDHDSYTSHYDPTVNVCYVRVNRLIIEGGILTDSVNIFDAFEGRLYATYLWTNPKKKKYWEVPPYDCHVDIPSKDSIRCGSSDEFDSLTEKYFGTPAH